MFNPSQRSANLNQLFAHEARLNRLHRLFKTHFNVTEPSLVLEPYLFLGNCISAHDIHRLTRLGIRYVLNVAKRDVEVCPYYPKEMRTLTIDLRDDDRENIIRAFDQTFAFIDEARRVNSRVLVHCSHGQSRSPAIVIAYLMRSYNVSLEQCLTHVVKARPCIIPNDGFLKQLILYDRFLVERRRQQQEAAVQQVIQNAVPTEIPIQHHPTNVSEQPEQPSVPVPSPPSNTKQEPVTVSSVDSSSLGLASSSSIQSSVSNSSIQVIPIQIQSKEPSPEKIEPVPIEKVSEHKINAIELMDKHIEKLERKLSTTHLSKTSSESRLESVSSSSNRSTRLKQRSNPKKKIEVKQNKSEQSRSQFKQPNQRHHHHQQQQQQKQRQHQHPSFDLTPQQWDFINNYPAHFGHTNEHVKTNYITEIYDRATNRFIPTTCCY